MKVLIEELQKKYPIKKFHVESYLDFNDMPHGNTRTLCAKCLYRHFSVCVLIPSFDIKREVVFQCEKFFKQVIK